MKRRYGCPKCGATLNPAGSIILLGSHEGERILIGFHPDPGNYEVYVQPETEIGEGQRWDLLCPVCHESLESPDIEDFCALDLFEEGRRRKLLFSRIRGRRATFVATDEGVQEEYGEHAAEYTPHLLNREIFL